MSDLAPIETAIARIKAGRMVILVDDEDRENEGDLVVAGSLVTAEHIRFMTQEGRGLICLALGPERADALDLGPMAETNTAPLGTAFLKSIDLHDGGGIGAAARAQTIRAAVDPSVPRGAFATPGHVFPLRAKPGGVLVRSGQTEGSVDLARHAGLPAAGVICEVMSPDGSMARLPKLLELGARYDIPVTSVADLIRYRLKVERLVRCVSSAHLPTEYGDTVVRCYENTISGQVHVALIVGEPKADTPTLVRVHRADTFADVFGLELLPSRSNLAWSLRRMAAEGAGVLLYLRAEGVRDDDLADQVRRYGAAARGERAERPGKPAMSFHDFGIGAQILNDVGLGKIRVITNNPRPFKGLSGHGLKIVGWVPIEGAPDAVDAGADGRGAS